MNMRKEDTFEKFHLTKVQKQLPKGCVSCNLIYAAFDHVILRVEYKAVKRLGPKVAWFHILAAGASSRNLGLAIFTVHLSYCYRRFAGENLVPKPADQVEEAEPWDGRQQRHSPLSPGVHPVPLLRRATLALPLGTTGKSFLLISVIIWYFYNQIFWQLLRYRCELLIRTLP